MSATISYNISIDYNTNREMSQAEPSIPFTLLLEPESRPSFSTLNNTIITLKVGALLSPRKPPVVFTVHKDLLCQSSDYFAERFKNGATDSETFSNDLAVYKPEVFAVVLDWIYYGRLPEPPDEWWAPLRDDYVPPARSNGSNSVTENGQITISAQTAPYEQLLVRLHSYAISLSIINLQSAIVRQVHAFARQTAWIPWFTTISLAYELLPHDSVLCRLFAEIQAVKYMPGREDDVERKEGEKLPRSFWRIVIDRLARERDGRGGVMFEMD